MSVDKLELNEEEVIEEVETNEEEVKPIPYNFGSEFYVEPREKGIYIPFSTIFKRDVDMFNYLPLHKRIQYNQTELIAEDYNLILDTDEKLYYKLLGLLFDIRVEKQTLTQEEFEELIIKFLKDNPIILERVSTNIEENYTLDLNSRSKSTTVNTELQVTDETNKVFLKGTMLMRFVIPLTCAFESRFQEKTNFDFFNLYSECLKMFSDTEDPNAIINKLHKLVFSRLVKTKYSNKVIWGYIRQKSDDVNATAISITRNIVNTVLLKTKNNTSIVSFLDVVIRKKIKFLFEYNCATRSC